MTKRSKKSSKQKGQFLHPQAASNEPEINPEATIGPEASMDATSTGLLSTDSTNAPVISKVQEVDEYSSSSAEMFERFLKGQMVLRPRSVFLILTLCWFGIISWLFLQDNQLDRLVSSGGMKWFGVKAGLYTVFYLIVAGIIWISSFLFRSNKGV